MATDGACSGNPGPGGWGVVLEAGGRRKELSGGAPETTNNRMELTAVLEGFRALTKPSTVRVLADSQYVVQAFNAGWLNRWQANGWRTANKRPVENQDLWAALLKVVAPHAVTWEWVRGHAGHPLNERADTLAAGGLAGHASPASSEDSDAALRAEINRLLRRVKADSVYRALFVNVINSDPAVLQLLREGGDNFC